MRACVVHVRRERCGAMGPTYAGSALKRNAAACRRHSDGDICKSGGEWNEKTPYRHGGRGTCRAFVVGGIWTVEAMRRESGRKGIGAQRLAA